MNRSIECRIATEEWEFEQIHRLNYKTFVEEIPQHQPNPEGRLVDKFHDRNTYVICIDNGRVVGMVAARGDRPFSLDAKLPNLDSYLPPNRRVCEIRLLSVEKEYRRGSVLRQLLATVAAHFIDLGFDTTVISGTLRQQRLYQHIGFAPFGPVIGTGDALYQPMFLTLERLREAAPVILQTDEQRMKPGTPLIFLPGPVDVHPDVQSAFSAAPVSHRAQTFVADFQETRSLLCDLLGARHAAIFLSSGTMANDVIAAQLSLRKERGLILSNGEFGQRLVDHARRFKLSFDVLEADWGEAFEASRIERAIDEATSLGWLWAVHCETSTGVLNDLPFLRHLCQSRGIKLCLDCISSIGVTPVNLRGVHLASGVSGKGLAALPGLAMVFHENDIEPSETLPRYLDLGFYVANGGIPFTHSSNLLYALRAALQRFAAHETIFADLAGLASWLRGELRRMGFQILADDAITAPAVITIALPSGCDSEQFGQRFEDEGVLLSYRSEYLLQRNWVQVCLMGQCSREKATALLRCLRRVAPASNGRRMFAAVRA
jgi:aspartate aminotransferase-like enzyme